MKKTLLIFTILLTTTLVYGDKLLDEQFDYASGLYKKGLYSMALGEYQKFLNQAPKKDPRQAEVHFFIGECYFHLAGPTNEKYYADAIKEYATVFTSYEKSEHTPLAIYRLGTCKYFQKDFNSAVDYLKRLEAAEYAAKLEPNIKERIKYYLGRSAFELGEFRKAAVYLKELTGAKSDKIREEAMYFTLTSYVKENNIKEANLIFSDFEALFRSSTLMGNARLMIANLLWENKDYQKAIPKYKLAEKELKSSVERANALRGLMWCLGATNQHQAAIDTAILLESLPDHKLAPEAAYFRLKTAFEQKKYDQAVKIYNEISGKYSEDPIMEKVWHDAAWSYRKLGNFEEITKIGKSFQTKFPKSDLQPVMLFLEGNALRQTQKYAEALTILLKIKNNPKLEQVNGICLLDIAYCLSKTKDYEGAAKTYDEFLETYSGKDLWKTFAANALLSSAELYIKMKNYDLALHRSVQFVNTYPKSPDIGKAIYWAGMSYYKQGKYVEMEKQLAKLSEKEETIPVLQLRAWYYSNELKNYSKASELYNKIISKFEKSSPEEVQKARKLLGISHYMAKENDKAYKLFHDYMVLYPNPAGADKLPAKIFFETAAYFEKELKNIKEASSIHEQFLVNYPKHEFVEDIKFLIIKLSAEIKDWDKVIKESEGFMKDYQASNRLMAIRYYYGLALKDKKKYEEALKEFGEISVNNRSKLQVMSDLEIGQILFIQEKWDEALNKFMRISVIIDDDKLTSEALIGAGQCFEKKNDFENARKQYKQFLANYPGNEKVKDVQEMLKKISNK